MKKKMNVLISIIVFLSLIILGIAKGTIVLPKNVRNLFYLWHDINPPKDLYVPIIVDDFRFYEKDFSKTYNLKPKYNDTYVFGISTNEKELDSKYRFNGKIKLEFFSGNEPVFEQIVIKMDVAWYLNNDINWYKKIALSYFEIPLHGKYRKDISVRVTVLEPDLELKDKKSLKLYMAVSATP